MDFGSGSQLLGGNVGPELQQAVANQRMGMAGATDQVTPGANPQGPMMAPPPTSDPSMGAPGQPGLTPQGGLTPEAENQIILQALATKLKSNSKIQEALSIPPSPPTNG